MKETRKNIIYKGWQIEISKSSNMLYQEAEKWIYSVRPKAASHAQSRSRKKWHLEYKCFDDSFTAMNEAKKYIDKCEKVKNN
jgi:hypothetical protein